MRTVRSALPATPDRPAAGRARWSLPAAGLAVALGAAPLVASLPAGAADPSSAQRRGTVTATRLAAAGTLTLPAAPRVLSGTLNSRGQAETVPLRNSGSQPLVVTGLAFTGPAAGRFVLVSAPALPFTLKAGAVVGIRVAVQSPVTGVLTAGLTVRSNDPAAPARSAPLRALVLANPAAEASLQQILDTWRIPVSTGDPNPADLYLPVTSPLGDELPAQLFVKAAPGPVTMTPLADYSGWPVNPTARLAWLPQGQQGPRVPLFAVPPAQARTLQVHPAGPTSFDPGGGPFGLAMAFPGTPRTVAQDDTMNAGNGGLKHAVRVYPYRTPDGRAVADSFVVAAEDTAASTAATCCEWNDLVVLVHNVRPLQLVGHSLDGLPFRDRLVTQRVGAGLTPAPSPVNARPTASYRLTNTGGVPRRLASAAVTGPFALVAPAALPAAVPPGGHLDVTVRLVASAAPRARTGTLTLVTDDPVLATRRVALGGTWQPALRGGNEPTLPDLVNGALGYATTLVKPGQSVNTKGRAVAVGEEVLTRAWAQADPARRVTVQQLAGFSDTAQSVSRYPASAGSCAAAAVRCKLMFDQVGADSQTLLPHQTSGAPAAVSFNSGAAFGLRIGGEDSNDAANDTGHDVAFGCRVACGHHVRAWPARDTGGHLIANSYLVACDVLGVNMDYQDVVLLVGNVRPA